MRDVIIERVPVHNINEKKKKNTAENERKRGPKACHPAAIRSDRFYEYIIIIIIIFLLFSIEIFFLSLSLTLSFHHKTGKYVL